MKPVNLFGSSQQAAKSAFGAAQKAFNIQADRSLELYGKLDVPDFQHIESKYGQDGLIQYIKTMESKKLQGGQ